MARIRSVHPGLFTDETFMAASPYARLLMIGLWTEADDQGVFEWKPLTLKARLLPVDTVDVVALLSEIESTGAVQRFDHEGKAFGAIRNFRKFQRPQKPNAVHPLPDSLRSYVALSGSVPVPTGEPSPTDTGNSDPMEDVGGGGSGGEAKEKVEKRESSLSASRLPEDWKVSDRGRDFATSKGVPVAKIEPEAEKFRLRWRQKTGDAGLCSDWEAAWEEWVIRSCEFNKYEPKASSSENVVALTLWVSEDDRRWPALADRYKAERGKWPNKVSSTTGPGLGWHFPREWLDAAEEAA